MNLKRSLIFQIPSRDVVGPPGLHTTTRELQTCTFDFPSASKHHQNSTRRHPERQKKERHGWSPGVREWSSGEGREVVHFGGGRRRGSGSPGGVRAFLSGFRCSRFRFGLGLLGLRFANRIVWPYQLWPRLAKTKFGQTNFGQINHLWPLGPN